MKKLSITLFLLFITIFSSVVCSNIKRQDDCDDEPIKRNSGRGNVKNHQHTSYGRQNSEHKVRHNPVPVVPVVPVVPTPAPVDDHYPRIDPLCAVWSGDKCTQCAPRAYFGENGLCVQSNPRCATFDNKGRCLTCYPGFKLNDDCDCVPIPPQEYKPTYVPPTPVVVVPVVPVVPTPAPVDDHYPRIDPLCAVWSGDKCTQCAPRAYFGENGKCVQSNPRCATFDNKGHCLTCYPGFKLNDDCDCVPIPPQEYKPTYIPPTPVVPPVPVVPTTPAPVDDHYTRIDPLCAVWSGDKCTQCAPRAYFGENGKCVQSNPRCATFDNKGHCLTCYPGFKLNDDCDCVPIPPQEYKPTYIPPTHVVPVVPTTPAPVDDHYTRIDPLCAIWRGEKCIQCVPRAYFGENGKCVQSNPRCATFDNRGHCLSCYSGFRLNDDCDCVQIPPQESHPIRVAPTPVVRVAPIHSQHHSYQESECSDDDY